MMIIHNNNNKKLILVAALLVVVVACACTPHQLVDAASCDGMLRETQNVETLRVVSFNTEFLFDGINDRESSRWFNDSAGAMQHLQDIADIITTVNPDIMGLIEVEHCDILGDLVDALGAPFEGYLRQGRDSGTGQDNALIVNYTSVAPSLTADRTDARVDTPVPGSMCGSTAVDDTGVSKNLISTFNINGANVTVIVIHFVAFPTVSTRCLQREGQASVIQQHAAMLAEQGHELIIMGDFNDFDGEVADVNGNLPTSRVLSLIKDLDGDGEDDLFNVLSLLPQSERYTAYYDANSNGMDDGVTERSAIDHMLVSKNLFGLVSNVEVRTDLFDAATTSDHWPLVVDFAIPDSLVLGNSSAAVHVSSSPTLAIALVSLALLLLSIYAVA